MYLLCLHGQQLQRFARIDDIAYLHLSGSPWSKAVMRAGVLLALVHRPACYLQTRSFEGEFVLPRIGFLCTIQKLHRHTRQLAQVCWSGFLGAVGQQADKASSC